jgi:anti-sigma-K factor RskA
MRYFAIGAAAVALTYFLDPKNGRWRREALRTWLAGAARRVREPLVVPEEAAVETGRNGRPSVGEERPAPAEATTRAPVTAGVAAAPEAEDAPRAAALTEAEESPRATVLAEAEKAPRAVALAEPPTASEAVLPPPLPPDLLQTPLQPNLEEPEPSVPASRKRRLWLIGTAMLVAAAFAVAGLAVWSFDLVGSSDDEPSLSAQALAALTQRQARAISIMAQPGATRLPVVGAEERLLLIVGMEGDAVLIVSRLAQAPAGKTYEIWVISGETPRPAGLFRGGKDTVVPLTRVVPKGATVALTLERIGGSPRPTSKPVYAVTRI